ncbi:MAG: LysE family translocator [Bacteroidetes bacterium]|nr:MAG: LysE family translocator [Bacteroidota bacterium]
MLDSSILIPFLTASVLLTFMPGPDIIFVIMQSITNGKKYGIVTALGLVSGIIIHTALIAFGIAVMIQRSDTLFVMIKILGAIYLFYLAFKTFKSSSEIHLEDVDRTKISLFSLYKQGFIMNLLNPKVVIFFLAFFPGFIVESNGNITRQIYILGLLFMLQAFLVFSFVSIVSDKLTSFLRGNKQFEKFLHWFQIVVFIAIGFYILFSHK